jgi:hypothetical protein
MDNPYEPPADVAHADDFTRRPLGVSILASLTGIFGTLMLGLYLFLLSNWQENNEGLLRQRIAPPLFWVMVGLTVALALASSVGMWCGRKWSWWIACSALVLYVLSNFGEAASIILAGGVFDLELAPVLRTVRSVVLSVLFALLLRYWLGLRVRRYFQFEQPGGIKAILLAGLSGIAIVVVITVVLLTIFMLRMRQVNEAAFVVCPTTAGLIGCGERLWRGGRPWSFGNGGSAGGVVQRHAGRVGDGPEGQFRNKRKCVAVSPYK